MARFESSQYTTVGLEAPPDRYSTLLNHHIIEFLQAALLLPYPGKENLIMELLGASTRPAVPGVTGSDSIIVRYKAPWVW